MPQVDPYSRRPLPNGPEWLGVVDWSSGKQSSAGFPDEAGARAWLAGRVEEIERNRWEAQIRLLNRRPGEQTVYDDVTYAQLLPGFPMPSGF